MENFEQERLSLPSCTYAFNDKFVIKEKET